MHGLTLTVAAEDLRAYRLWARECTRLIAYCAAVGAIALALSSVMSHARTVLELLSALNVGAAAMLWVHVTLGLRKRQRRYEHEARRTRVVPENAPRRSEAAIGPEH